MYASYWAGTVFIMATIFSSRSCFSWGCCYFSPFYFSFSFLNLFLLPLFFCICVSTIDKGLHYFSISLLTLQRNSEMRKYLLFQDHVLSNLILKIMGKLLFPVCRSWNWSSAKWNSLPQITLLVIPGLCNSKVLVLLSLFLYHIVSCIDTSPLFFSPPSQLFTLIPNNYP